MSRYQTDVERHIIEKFVNPPDQARFDHAQLCKAAEARLKQLVRQQNKTHYFICESVVKSGRGTGAPFRTAYEDLKAKFKSIIFIELSSDFDLYLREQDVLSPIGDMLLQEAKGKQ